jgi:hypothetical protein
VADETETTEASLQRIARENVALLAERDALRAAIQAAAKLQDDWYEGRIDEPVFHGLLAQALAAAGVDREDPEQPDPLDTCARCGAWRKYHDEHTHTFVGDTGQADEPQRVEGADWPLMQCRNVTPHESHVWPYLGTFRKHCPGVEDTEQPETCTEDHGDWDCNHCEVCGKGIVYGSRCHDHPAAGPNAVPGPVGRDTTGERQ